MPLPRQLLAPAILLIAGTACALPPQPSHFAFYERYIAIDDACAWPKLNVLPNGNLAVLIWPYNNHGATEGAIECWTSSDNGVRWKKAGVPLANAPGTNYIHIAGGVVDGELMAVVGGLGARPAYFENARFAPKNIAPFKTPNLPARAALSKDGGRTWATISGPLPNRPLSGRFLTPFGRIEKLRTGEYGVCLYGDGVYFFTSADRGATWAQRGVLTGPRPDLPEGGTHNETTWIELKSGDLYAASRSYANAGLLGAGGLDGFRSQDGGRTWTSEGALALPNQFPADLTLLPDGRVLLTYASRNEGSRAIWVRFGSPDAHAWSAPMMLVDLEGSGEFQYKDNVIAKGARGLTDGGYPSTVIAADGTMVTAYYCRGVPAHQRYHMGVVRWRLATE